MGRDSIYVGPRTKDIMETLPTEDPDLDLDLDLGSVEVQTLYGTGGLV